MEQSRSFATRADNSTTIPTIHVPKSKKFFRFFHIHPHHSTPPPASMGQDLKKKGKNLDNGLTSHPDETEISFAERRERKEEIFSALSGATSLALSTLQDAASLAPVPYLSEAAGLALGIWNAVQNTRNAKSSLLSLGEDACTLVYTVWTTCDEILLRQRDAGVTPQAKLEVEVQTQGDVKDDDHVTPRPSENGDGEKRGAEVEKEEHEIEKLNPQLESNLKKLCSTLNEISAFATRTASRNVVLRFLTSDADTGKVAEYQAKIKSALDLFTLQSNISIQQIISRIEVQQRAMQEQVQLRLASSPRHSSAEAPATTDSLLAKVSPRTTSAPTSRALEGSPPPPAAAGSPATTLSAGATAFPAIFSFAGATFNTGNTNFTTPTRKTQHKKPTASSSRSQAKSETDSKFTSQSNIQSRRGSSPGDSNNVDIRGDVTPVDGAVASGEVEDRRSSSSIHTTESERETKTNLANFKFGGSNGNGNGNIQFTSIAGDQNTSWVNDQSRRWNFGNTYEHDPSGGMSRREETINAAKGRLSPPGPNAARIADAKYRGAVGRGRGVPPRESIAALGKEAFGFGRNHAHNARDSGMRGRRGPVRGRREANANYWDPEGDRDGYYDHENITGNGNYGSEYGYGEEGNRNGAGEFYRYRRGPTRN